MWALTQCSTGHSSGRVPTLPALPEELHITQQTLHTPLTHIPGRSGTPQSNPPSLLPSLLTFTKALISAPVWLWAPHHPHPLWHTGGIGATTAPRLEASGKTGRRGSTKPRVVQLRQPR